MTRGGEVGEAVLAANAAFYRAFAAQDFAAMDALWARETPVACVHPGWEPLLGRASVMASWAAILGGSEAPRIRCEAPRAFPLGAGAFVVCREVLEGRGALAATNAFAREAGGWRMVHHQAGPAAASPSGAERAPGTLH